MKELQQMYLMVPIAQGKIDFNTVKLTVSI